MDIITGNKLIAEFMGCQIDKRHATMHVWIEGEEPTMFYCQWHPDYDWKEETIVAWDFAPNKNWCQLMPVVEKIEGIKNSDDYEVDIFGNCCDIGGKFESTGKTKIEATWKCVIKFIQWYNTQPH